MIGGATAAGPCPLSAATKTAASIFNLKFKANFKSGLAFNQLKNFIAGPICAAAAARRDRPRPFQNLPSSF
jgi:hypothetical protein